MGPSADRQLRTRLSIFNSLQSQFVRNRPHSAITSIPLAVEMAVDAKRAAIKGDLT